MNTTTDTTTTVPTTAAALVAEAARAVRGLSPAEFAAEAEREDAVVVDLREADERVTQGSIPGAIPIPRGMLEFRADPSSPYHDERLRPDRPVRLHCASGGRSALAAAALHSLGYRDVAHLDGGFTAWSAAGYPVTGKASSPY